jgi:hypothetical protein
MKATEEKLPAKRERALLALLECREIKAAAEKAKVGESTLDWLWVRAQNILNDSSTKSAIQTVAQAIMNEPEVHGLRTIPALHAKAIIEERLRIAPEPSGV